MTRKYLMSALLLVLTIPAYAQSKQVVGIVTSAEIAIYYLELLFG